MVNVTYSAAYDSNGVRIEAIGDSKGVPPYYCPGCNAQMIAKNTERPNRKREKHFAHKSKDTNCSKESMLHGDAKRLIAKSIRDESSYWITVTCGNTKYTSSPCENVLSRMDLAGADADIEKYIVGNKADVLVRTQEGKEIIIAIEVVVHHETTPESRSRYELNEIPVVFVRVKSQEDIPPLHERIVIDADDYIGDLPPCDVCVGREKKEAEHQRARAEAEHQRARAEAERQRAKAEAERQRARAEAERQRARAEAERQRARAEAERQRARIEAEPQRMKAEAELRQAMAEAASERRRALEEALADESKSEIQKRRERLIKAYGDLEKYQSVMGNTNMMQYNRGKQACISSAGTQTCGTLEQDCPLLLCNKRYLLGSDS